MTSTTCQWYETLDNVLRLAEALDDAGHFWRSRSMLYMIRKPWKWDAEWAWLEQRGTMEGFGEQDDD